jgi:hypothetical protein
MEEEYLSDNNKDPEDIYGPRYPGEIEPGDYMEDYMCSYEDCYAGDPRNQLKNMSQTQWS